MKKTLAILATVAAVGATTVTAPAEARGIGPGLAFGLAAGAIAAGAAGAYGYYGPGYGYGYGPRYYGYGPYYGPSMDTVPITGRPTVRAMPIMAGLMVGRIGGTAIGIAVTGKRVSFSKDNSLAKEKPGGHSGLFCRLGGS